MRYRLLVIVALASALVGPRALADSRTEKAREHYLQGDAYYKLDKYADALREYEQAYIAKPDPSFLYNIAQCHRLMGNRADAAKFYRRYLKDAPTAGNRAIAEKHIRELEATLAQSPDPAHAPASGAAAGGASATPAIAAAPAPAPAPAPAAQATTPSPMPAPAPTTAQPNLALASPPPFEPRVDVGAGAGEQAQNDTQEKNGPFYTRWWFWTAVGVAVAGTVILVATAPGDPSCPTGSICK